MAAQRLRARPFEEARDALGARRPARVALQLALTYRIHRAIDAGEIKDQAEAVRRLGLTRARVSRVLDPTLLAPDLQEQILLLEVIPGVEHL